MLHIFYLYENIKNRKANVEQTLPEINASHY